MQPRSTPEPALPASPRYKSAAFDLNLPCDQQAFKSRGQYFLLQLFAGVVPKYRNTGKKRKALRYCSLAAQSSSRYALYWKEATRRQLPSPASAPRRTQSVTPRHRQTGRSRPIARLKGRNYFAEYWYRTCSRLHSRQLSAPPNGEGTGASFSPTLCCSTGMDDQRNEYSRD